MLELTSTGTLLAFAALMTSASIRLACGSSDPPLQRESDVRNKMSLFQSSSGNSPRTCLTAMIILFPKTAFVFAFLASVLDLVAARTAAARPMKRGERADSRWLLVNGDTEKAATPDKARAKTKVDLIIILGFQGERRHPITMFYVQYAKILFLSSIEQKAVVKSDQMQSDDCTHTHHRHELWCALVCGVRHFQLLRLTDRIRHALTLTRGNKP